MTASSLLTTCALAGLALARPVEGHNLLPAAGADGKAFPAFPVYEKLPPEFLAQLAEAGGWHLVLGEGGRAKLTCADGQLKVSIEEGGRIWWAVQVSFIPLPLLTGRSYEVRFKARAQRPQPMILDIAQVGTWYSYSPRVEFPLTTEWQEFTTRFEMGKAASEPNARFEFNLGHHGPNLVEFADASVTEVPARQDAPQG